MKKVSIIIPAYNEQKYLPILLKKIIKINLNKINFKKEIIVINDGSTDNTKKVIEKFKNIKIINQKNQGKGRAVQNGIKKASGELILIQDADLEYDPKDYFKLLKPFKKHKRISVYGTRYFKKNITSYKFTGKKNKQNFMAFIFNFLISSYFFILFGKYITDLLTGYKLYPKELFNNIKIKTNGFETDHEITVNLLKQKYKILEVPIKYYPRSHFEGKKINFFDALKALWVISRMRFSF